MDSFGFTWLFNLSIAEPARCSAWRLVATFRGTRYKKKRIVSHCACRSLLMTERCFPPPPFPSQVPINQGHRTNISLFPKGEIIANSKQDRGPIYQRLPVHGCWRNRSCNGEEDEDPDGKEV